MFETLKNAFRIKEVRKKIFLTILLIILYRLGCFIPVPGIDAAALRTQIGENNFLGIMSAITGGALQNGTLFAIGIGPYITASIIIQLLTVAIPALTRLSKQGEEGRKKITKITRYVTLVLTIVNAVGILLSLGGSGIIDKTPLGVSVDVPTWIIYVFVVLMFSAGSMLCMFIGERITEYGISNGISLLIFVGILSTAGNSILTQIRGIAEGGWDRGGWELIGFLAILLVIFTFIVFIDKAERKIPIQYAKQVKGNKMYGGQSTFIPIRVNASGVMPLIFAYALMSFPQMLFNTFWPTADWVIWINQHIGAGTWVYALILAVLILLFAFFYSQIQFNPIEISKNIQQNGGFIPGIRPGKATSDYLAKVVSRITLFGAIFLAIIALVPSLAFGIVGANNTLLNAFSSTGMLIVVSVALEFDKALENQIMMRYYKGFLG